MHSFEWVDVTSIEEASRLLAAGTWRARLWPKRAASISWT